LGVHGSHRERNLVFLRKSGEHIGLAKRAPSGTHLQEVISKQGVKTLSIGANGWFKQL
jgi:hypothetical protein